MSRRKWTAVMMVGGIVCLCILWLLGGLRLALDTEEQEAVNGTYASLPADISTEEPLSYLAEDFTVLDGFSSNLPIVILSLEEEPPQYKTFSDSQEVVDEEVEPYVSGSIRILSSDTGMNYLTDEPVYASVMQIKKRGHSSMDYDKPQYLMKMQNAAGEDNDTDILGMGEGHEWILNGSMADKSMIRNYLCYRIASEIGGNVEAPDSRFCEVLMEKEDGSYEYRGVYLLMETISRGESRVDIDEFKTKNSYSSYIVRRDRYTSFDVMLDTYGRLNGLSEQWIGIKYPSQNKLTESAKLFIEQDFSSIERILYATDESVFKAYDKYIDIDSFVDYFLINEFFGNYDAGEHSTYMYKNSGERLHIGPVWDFDQAMNNYFDDEMDPYSLAFQTKPFYEQLCKDERFLDCLKTRYGELRKGVLSEEHVFAVMDEAVAYLDSAREREWYRWAEDYLDGSFENWHNYYLQDYMKDGVVISRFNDDYEQELYTMRTYLHKHGNVIQLELTKLYDSAEYNTSIKNENELLLLIILVLFLVPSILINRR